MSEKINKDKPAKVIERATISESLKDKLMQLTNQANDALQGIASISKSDVINLILSGHSGSLSPLELEKLRDDHVDEIKYAYWIASQLKLARDRGENLSIEYLLSQRNSDEEKVNAKKPRKRRLKLSEESAQNDPES